VESVNYQPGSSLHSSTGVAKPSFIDSRIVEIDVWLLLKNVTLVKIFFRKNYWKIGDEKSMNFRYIKKLKYLIDS
jgi:hypothetical protein